ncbi:hypothetical protein K461DRAFT_274633 [Myriangium duriaei CBS 260.36]|uniref:Uncharacterized protein n=1 Tax=Myriangium duriaei CBS 260.36 TaxID=1168546 RepID=A0A9P4J557_9PEZI|nr:hypothetical protein K461DRAFT_274633 [Myriangium duriaei CBS 260.36]
MVAEPQAVIEAPPQPDDDIPEAYKEDFDADFPAKEKVHICGLDGVAQDVIEQFLAEHLGERKYRRLEWIDDSSLNIIYYKPEDAAEALNRLSVTQDTLPPPAELRPAKPFSTRPDLQFSLRQALVSDKKKPGAKDRSAFYLFHPEWEPENRKYDKRYDRRGRGGRNGQREGERRARPRPHEPFTEDMYDDAPTGTSDERDLARRMSSASISSGSQEFRRRRKYEEGDLFTNTGKRDAGRLRDRSRSPERDEDGRYGFAEDQPRRRAARRRSWTPPSKRPAVESRASNAGKELFGDRAASSASTPLSSGNSGVELFPNHSSKRSRELFPHKTAHSNHRRTDALDKAETAEILNPGTRSLADRITGGPAPAGIRGRGAVKANDGFSIRGAGDGQPGFSIRGASKELNPKVKELFPDKAPSSSNKGKELFPSRSGPRRRAEDLMD